MGAKGWYLIAKHAEGGHELFDDRRLPIEAPKEAKISLGYWDGAEWHLPDREIPQAPETRARKEP